MFKDEIPQDVSYLMIVALIFAPVWLVIVLLIGPLAKHSAKAKVKEMGGSGGHGGGGRVKPDCRTTFDVVARPSKVARPSTLDVDNDGLMSTTDYKTAYSVWTLNSKTTYGGILWTYVYFMWALGPILINPLKNDFGPGTNSVPLPDLLTASKQRALHI